MQRPGRAPTRHNSSIDLVDRLLRQPDRVFAVSTLVVLSLVQFIDGLLEIVSALNMCSWNA